MYGSESFDPECKILCAVVMVLSADPGPGRMAKWGKRKHGEGTVVPKTRRAGGKERCQGEVKERGRGEHYRQKIAEATADTTHQRQCLLGAMSATEGKREIREWCYTPIEI